MKNINVTLTPLNAIYSSAQNSFVTFSQTKYDSLTNRAVLVKDYKKSYFKFKKGTEMPYIEFPLFSLKTGDVVNVDFDYMITNEITLQFEVYELNSNYTSLTQKNFKVKLDKVGNLFHHNFILPITKQLTDSIGFLLNIRLIEGVEAELSSISLNIKTSNYNCNYNKEIIKIDNKELLDYASSVTLKNKINGDDYSGGLALISNYRTLNSDGSVTFTSEDSNFKFKGLVFKISNPVKRSCGIYVKYKASQVFSCGFRATHPVTGVRYSGKVTLHPTDGVITETIVRGLNPSDTNLPPKHVVIEISVMDTCDFTLYEVACDNSCLYDDFIFNSNNNDFYKINAMPTSYITV